MNPQERSRALFWRLAWIGWALLLLAWMPLEDTHPRGAVMIAAVFTSLVMVRTGARLYEAQRPGLSALLGCAAGMLTTPFTLFLMVLKSGLHAHPIPEFPIAQFLWVIVRTPIWIVAGGLAGLAVSLLAAARRQTGP